MTRIKWLVPSLAMLALGGCSATAGIGSATSAASAAGGVIGQIPEFAGKIYGIAPAIVLQNYQTLHNLRVGMDQIDSTPGMVTTEQPPPIVVRVP